MASRTKRREQVNRPDGNEPAVVVADQLEALARQGARQMLTDALHEEVESYLQPGRYRRHEDEACFRGYCNGTSPRRLTLGARASSPHLPAPPPPSRHLPVPPASSRQTCPLSVHMHQHPTH